MGVNDDWMIWRSDELFWVPSACGVDVSVARLLRCSGV